MRSFPLNDLETSAMENNMIIDNDFLSEEEIKNLQTIMYLDQSRPFPWFFSSHGSFDFGDNRVITNKSFNDHFQFVHPVQSGNQIFSPFMPHAKNILDKFTSKHNIKVENILRIKANLIPNENRNRPEINLPHVDNVGNLIDPNHSGKHYVLLYYVNDSDGPTTTFNEFYSGEAIADLTVASQIYPEAGKAILFDGNQYHASAAPRESDFRCIININFIGSVID